MGEDPRGRGPRPTFRVRISPDDVGARVTVRLRIDADAGGPHHTDVVGHLRAWEHGELQIEDRHGETVVVAEERLVAGRVVRAPPRRPRPR